MDYIFQEPAQGQLKLLQPAADFVWSYQRAGQELFYALLWNNGPDTVITIDEVDYTFPAGHFLCLMVHQSFRLHGSGQIVIWQFNRDFYCIVDHDRELSCAGFLFYGARDIFFINLQTEPAEMRKISALLEVFTEEFQTRDSTQGEMLRMQVKYLIILLTRLTKKQLPPHLPDPDLDLVRRFNLLVEGHYRQLHQVQDYAKLLHKSPKTLSNLFAAYNRKSPLQVIQERIFMEARRFLLYTDKNLSEIAGELGFEELTHFSRFFRKMAGETPSAFRKGKN